jgi:hypothetical protein
MRQKIGAALRLGSAWLQLNFLDTSVLPRFRIPRTLRS